MEYYSGYFKEYFNFPTTIDAAQAFGNPVPSFYGVFFYPLLSLLGLATGPDSAVRIFCGATLLTFAVIFRSMTKNWSISILFSVTTNTSAYQLTNLYSMSALTEFAAHQSGARARSSASFDQSSLIPLGLLEI